MKPIDFSNCEIGSVASRKDGSVRLSVETSELTTDQRALVLGYHGKACRVLLCPIEHTDAPVEQVTTEKGDKTPSQRLRACVFVWWQQLGGNGDFERFYREKMEVLINYVKKELDQ